MFETRVERSDSECVVVVCDLSEWSLFLFWFWGVCWVGGDVDSARYMTDTYRGGL